MKYWIIIIFFSLTTHSFAQVTDPETLNRVNKVKECLQKEDYKCADEELKKVFAKQTATLPDEVSYYYGKVLFNQKKYTQAKNTLLKYQTLTKEKGSYSPEAKTLLKDAECAETGYYTYTDTCFICYGEGRIWDKCLVCNGKGLEFCHTCGGSGVASNNNNGFGNGYQTCKKCEGKGYHACTACHGEKKQKKLCDNCKGAGITKVRLKCIQ